MSFIDDADVDINLLLKLVMQLLCFRISILQEGLMRVLRQL